MRYFLVSGKIIINKTAHFQDSVCFSSENFPSRTSIKSAMIENYERIYGDKVKESSGILILNLFEFNNEKDCNDYSGIVTPPIEKEMD